MVKTVYIAENEYASCEFSIEEDDTLLIRCIFHSIDGVSAIHIHSAAPPNPILAWLATSVQWENGVAQTSFQSNLPCCSNVNGLCNLQAPAGTPLVDEIELDVIYEYRVQRPVEFCISTSVAPLCPWTSKGTLLNVHGTNFLYYNNNCGQVPEGAIAGTDLLISTEFQDVS